MGNWRCSLPSVEVMSRKGRECRATKPGETNRNQPSEDRGAESAPERRKGTSDSRGELGCVARGQVPEDCLGGGK